MDYKCPKCKAALQWRDDNEFRPFCSDQCKNKDFIAWANEGHVIDGTSTYDDLLSDELNSATQAHQSDKIRQISDKF